VPRLRRLVALALLGPGLVSGRAQADAAVRSNVTLVDSSPTAEERAIQKVLEAYVRAIETRDLDLFRVVKPNLSAEEEKKVRKAFESLKSQVVEITVQSAEIHDSEAMVKVSRRDTINGSIVSSFPQSFSLAKSKEGWSIRDIAR
jgi:hypothetical protein